MQGRGFIPIREPLTREISLKMLVSPPSPLTTPPRGWPRLLGKKTTTLDHLVLPKRMRVRGTRLVEKPGRTPTSPAPDRGSIPKI